MRAIDKMRLGRYKFRHEGQRVDHSSVPFAFDVKSIFTSMPLDKTEECVGSMWEKLRRCAFPEHPLSAEELKQVVCKVMASSSL